MLNKRFSHVKEYGETKCPDCDKIFFSRKALVSHWGGAHRKDITNISKNPVCKFCETELIVGKTWAEWAAKARNLICKNCKRKQNAESYQKKIKNKG